MARVRRQSPDPSLGAQGARLTRAPALAEPIRAWRSPAAPGLVFMRGATPSYSVRPNGECFVAVVGRSAVLRRGRERHVLHPGDLGVWDPSRPHSGSPLDGRAWTSRLMVIELRDLREAAADAGESLPDLEFPDPIVRDAHLARELVRLHRLSGAPVGALEWESGLAEWCRRLAGRSPRDAAVAERRRAARADPALRRACELLGDDVVADVTLAQLAATAGVGRFRLLRLFRAGLGVPPHRFQLSRRIALARRLLERGARPADAATGAGFFDQSHLHRHFRRALGLTPAEYARAVARKNVQDAAAPLD